MSQDVKSATLPVKDRIRRLLDTLPDNATLEDVQYHLYVMEKVENSLAEAADPASRIAHEDVKRKYLG